MCVSLCLCLCLDFWIRGQNERLVLHLQHQHFLSSSLKTKARFHDDDGSETKRFLSKRERTEGKDKGRFNEETNAALDQNQTQLN